MLRAHAAVLLEGMVGGSERDGRSWQAEWVALPEVCLLTTTAVARLPPVQRDPGERGPSVLGSPPCPEGR